MQACADRQRHSVAVQGRCSQPTSCLISLANSRLDCHVNEMTFGAAFKAQVHQMKGAGAGAGAGIQLQLAVCTNCRCSSCKCRLQVHQLHLEMHEMSNTCHRRGCLLQGTAAMRYHSRSAHELQQPAPLLPPPPLAQRYAALAEIGGGKGHLGEGRGLGVLHVVCYWTGTLGWCLLLHMKAPQALHCNLQCSHPSCSGLRWRLPMYNSSSSKTADAGRLEKVHESIADFCLCVQPGPRLHGC